MQTQAPSEVNDVIPFNIGIATAPAPSVIILPGDTSGGGSDLALVGTDGEPLNALTWPKYLAWRKTKTRPYDRDAHFNLKATRDGVELGGWKNHRVLEEIDQATAEMIGEVAELGELFMDFGPTAFWGDVRDKLIDECGDVLFCASWALDAWGLNPLAEIDDLEFLRVTPENGLAHFAEAIASHEQAVALSDQRFTSLLGGLIFNLMLSAQTNAGLTANSYKKLKFQGREQDVRVQVSRISTTLLDVNQILIVANSSIEEALKVNMKKLDARRPGGYDPAKPGGIRTGDGK